MTVQMNSSNLTWCATGKLWTMLRRISLSMLVLTGLMQPLHYTVIIGTFWSSFIHLCDNCALFIFSFTATQETKCYSSRKGMIGVLNLEPLFAQIPLIDIKLWWQCSMEVTSVYCKYSQIVCICFLDAKWCSSFKISPCTWL